MVWAEQQVRTDGYLRTVARRLALASVVFSIDGQTIQTGVEKERSGCVVERASSERHFMRRAERVLLLPIPFNYLQSTAETVHRKGSGERWQLVRDDVLRNQIGSNGGKEDSISEVPRCHYQALDAGAT